MVEGSGAVERSGVAESILVATLRVVKVPLTMVDAMRLRKKMLALWPPRRQVKCLLAALSTGVAYSKYWEDLVTPAATLGMIRACERREALLATQKADEISSASATARAPLGILGIQYSSWQSLWLL